MNERSMFVRRLILALYCTAMFGCAVVGEDRGADVVSAAETPGVSQPAVTGRSNGAKQNRFEYFGGLTLDDSVPAPVDVLGYHIGEHFTRAADMVDYMQQLAESSKRVAVQRYGQTHQRRPLMTLTITSESNHQNLNQILRDNRALADPSLTNTSRIEQIIDSNPAVVWFSYNVHGNEPSPMETAMQVAYTMAAAQNDEVQEILDKVVLVIDPLLNPDGHERYVNWYQQTRGAEPISNLDAAEHHEPWPGGRTNHYLFDLNRDWLWLEQPESEARLEIYNRYLPQLHIDFHEQGLRSPYFLGAGDEPYNTNIPDATRRWIHKYGEANARVFDQYGRVYSSRERFDYLYPGYGKVLPVYHGAIGMLAEQAGHSGAGLAADIDGEYTLTLTDRAENHFLLSMSNLETTAKHRRGQLERFRRYFVDSASLDKAGPRAFFISADNDPALLKKAWDLCNAHDITIESLDQSTTIQPAHSYLEPDSEDSARDLPAGTWVIRVNQAMGRLVRALFEPNPTITDEDTYDITAWSMPVAFGLEAWYTNDPFTAPTTTLSSYAKPKPQITGDGNVALLVDSRQHDFPRAIGLAERRELFARLAGQAFTVDNRQFARGSLIVHFTRNDTKTIERFTRALSRAGLSAHRASSGMTSSGPVLGANENEYLEPPKIALLRHRPFSSNSFGAHWFMLDHQMPMPHVPINVDDLRRTDLEQYNTLVMQS